MLWIKLYEDFEGKIPFRKINNDESSLKIGISLKDHPLETDKLINILKNKLSDKSVVNIPGEDSIYVYNNLVPFLWGIYICEHNYYYVNRWSLIDNTTEFYECDGIKGVIKCIKQPINLNAMELWSEVKGTPHTILV